MRCSALEGHEELRVSMDGEYEIEVSLRHAFEVKGQGDARFGLSYSIGAQSWGARGHCSPLRAIRI